VNRPISKTKGGEHQQKEGAVIEDTQATVTRLKTKKPHRNPRVDREGGSPSEWDGAVQKKQINRGDQSE